MANLSKPNLGFSPNRGRAALDKLSEELMFRGRQVAASRPFVAFVVVAAVLLGIYFFFISAPIYVSQSSFIIRGRDQPSAASGLLGALGGTSGGGDTGGSETAELKQYAQSEEMLEKLDRQFNLRGLYSQPRMDLFHWMPRHAGRERFLNFYRKMIQIRVEPQSDIFTVEVHSFDPVSAQKITAAVLNISADYLEGLSAIVRKETLRASEKDLQDAEEAVRASRLVMTQYRTSTGMLDPVVVAGARSSSVIGMQDQVQQSQADLASLETFNTAKSPQVTQLKARIAALQAQINKTQSDLTAPRRSDTLAQKLLQYEGLIVTNDYNEKQLVAALSSYDSAKSLASQRERFLVKITNPNLPDRPALPHRLLSFIESLIVVVAGYGVIALAIAGIRDHQGI